MGTEHILIGLLLEKEGEGGKILRRLGLTDGNVMRVIEGVVGIGTAVTDNPVLTTKTRLAMEEASREAAKQSRPIETDIILWGLLQQEDSMAVHVLENMDIDTAGVIEEIEEGVPVRQGGEETPDTDTGTEKENPLALYGRDLNKDAKDGKVDPVIGRDKEIDRVIQILCRRTKNNPVLLGSPGVGKTAVAEGLAQKIADGHIPKPLADKRVISLSMASLVAGTKYRGEFEERIKQLLEAVKEDSSLILFIDELHQLIGAGSAEGTMDAADILKPALARGELQCIGATTTDEYRKYIEKDSALTRRFQPVRVEEPTEEEALSILQGLKGPYEDFHHVHFTDEALSDAVKLSARYIADRYLPDKAIDVIDEAASKVRLEHAAPTGELKEAEDELARIEKKKSELSAAEKFEECAALRDKAKEMEERIRELKEAQKAKDRPQVLSSHIADVVSVWSGVPVQKIGTTEAQRLLNLEDELHKRVIGQDEAVRAVAKAMRRSGAGLKDPKRPVGSFLFLGPSGVGKTELARALAAGLFGDEEAMIRIDMSEFTESHAVARLVGSPPGYVGYDEGGELTDKVREKPYSVILFDEVEKASHNFFNLLLQILDDGRLTDSKGRTVDFRNTVIIMTGNLGANRLKSEVPTMGFNVGHESEDDRLHAFEGVKKDIMTDVRKFFKPEFLNRLDEILIFKPLAKDDLRHIVRLMIHTLEDKVKEKGVVVDVTEKATEVLVGEGTDFAYGARPLRRALQKLVEDKLSEYMLEGTLKEGMKVCIDSKDGKKIDFQMI